MIFRSLSDLVNYGVDQGSHIRTSENDLLDRLFYPITPGENLLRDAAGSDLPHLSAVTAP